jgi:ElaB/YqjD/DUF883 family membrane-anchored ribosome-binding protein
VSIEMNGSKKIIMAKNPDEPAGDLTAELAALREDIARLTDTVAGIVRHEARAAGAAASSMAAGVADGLSDATEGVRDRAEALGTEIEACIVRYPVSATLIAFGLGVVLGMISRPRG